MELPYNKDNLERMPLEFYQEAYEKIDPVEASQRTGLPYDEEKQMFQVRLMGVTYQVSWPGFEVKHLDREDIGYYPLEDKADARILVMRYITGGTASMPLGKFLTYREVPWGELYFKQFQGRCLMRLAFGFGYKIEEFKKIMEFIGAAPISTGDAGYELEFMNNLNVRFMLWEGDDEFQPSAQILFADNCLQAFDGYDMAVIGDITISEFKAISKMNKLEQRKGES